MYHETRTCEVCGEEHYDGMTNDDGDLWVCEDCFERYMDETYGKHKWMEIADDGSGGYYIYSMPSVIGGYFGTGIYYTTRDWED